MKGYNVTIGFCIGVDENFKCKTIDFLNLLAESSLNAICLATQFFGEAYPEYTDRITHVNVDSIIEWGKECEVEGETCKTNVVANKREYDYILSKIACSLENLCYNTCDMLDTLSDIESKIAIENEYNTISTVCDSSGISATPLNDMEWMARIYTNTVDESVTTTSN